MLTNKSLQAIKDNLRCRNRLAYEMNVNPRTIDRWIEGKDIMLTTAKALTIIIEETGLTQEEILEKEIA